MKEYASDHVLSLVGNTGQNPKVLLPQHGNEAIFSCFSTFQALDYSSIFKYIQAYTFGFIREDKIGPLNKCAKFH